MFFKVLAAIVTADTFDRHMRAQQRRVWMTEDARREGAVGVPAAASKSRWIPPGETRWNLRAPERPS